MAFVRNLLMGSVFTSTGAQNGGQETTFTSFHSALLHQGMVVVGLPYSVARQMTLDEITGGSPCGATTIAGTDESSMPSENELAMARFQGHHVTDLAKRLVKQQLFEHWDSIMITSLTTTCSGCC